jgi:small subunit ribosomal protein S1
MTKIAKKQSQKMKELLSKGTAAPPLPQAGELVEGKIIEMSKTALILDLGPLGTGIVYGAELRENKNLIKGLKIGDTISVLVLDPENEDGYVELSLKEANLEKAWQTLKEKKQAKEIVTAKVIEANRGGLVVNLYGLIGFLPVSQLSSQNYPRVEGGNKGKILNHLNKFINKEIKVKILSLDQNTKQLIVSEKAIQEEKNKENLKGYKKGDVIKGTVTGLTDFGAFIKFGPDLEGLAHISELDWSIIEHPADILQEGQQVKAQIIDIQGGQVSLSLKALKNDPWQNIEQKYQPGQIVKGRVTKLNPFGAFVEIDKDIYGLVHVSEFTEQNQPMEEILKIGQSYDFKILSLEPKAHKISLGLLK